MTFQFDLVPHFLWLGLGLLSQANILLHIPKCLPSIKLSATYLLAMNKNVWCFFSSFIHASNTIHFRMVAGKVKNKKYKKRPSELKTSFKYCFIEFKCNRFKLVTVDWQSQEQTMPNTAFLTAYGVLNKWNLYKSICIFEHMECLIRKQLHRIYNDIISLLK